MFINWISPTLYWWKKINNTLNMWLVLLFNLPSESYGSVSLFSVFYLKVKGSHHYCLIVPEILAVLKCHYCLQLRFKFFQINYQIKNKNNTYFYIIVLPSYPVVEVLWTPFTSIQLMKQIAVN